MTGSGRAASQFHGANAALPIPRGKTLPVGEMGELLFRGPGMLKGYYGKPDVTAARLPWRMVPLGRFGAHGCARLMSTSSDARRT